MINNQERSAHEGGSVSQYTTLQDEVKPQISANKQSAHKTIDNDVESDFSQMIKQKSEQKPQIKTDTQKDRK